MEKRMNNGMAQESAEEMEITAQELGENLAENAVQEIPDETEEIEDIEAAVREGIAALYADGFTLEELKAFSLDEQAQRDVAEGIDVMRAACRYMRRMMLAQPKRRGVPTMRRAAAGAMPMENAVENMTDAQFEAFSRRAQAEMMAGKKVRI